MKYQNNMDYYQTLGVDSTATADEIKKAYRKLCNKHHPDKGGDEQQFKNIQEAYEVLGDKEKKQQYDNPAREFQFNTGNMHDMFSSIFTFTQNNVQKNFDSRTKIVISLKDAFFGKQITVNDELSGKVFEVKIPKGIRDGGLLRVEKQGSRKNPNLPPGDLFIEVRIKCPRQTYLANNDIFYVVNIDAIDAMMGKKIKINHVNNKEYMVQIPAGTQNGEKVKLAKLGMQTINHVIGDFYVVVNVSIPKIIGKESINLLTKLRKLTK